MGLLPSSIRLLATLHKEYSFSGPVCSLGNQDIWASAAEVSDILAEVGCQAHSPAKVELHSSRTFQMDATLSSVSKEFVHARTFFETMGLADYLDMDKFDSDHPAILHDLNDPVPESLRNRFGLILDGGTVEHIFDMRQVFGNIVNMLRVNGCVLHIASFSIDHGLYGLSPTLFFDYYDRNGFDRMKCFLMEVDFSDITKSFRDRHRLVRYEYGMSLDGVLKAGVEVLVFFVARKVRQVAETSVPTQGAYARRGNLEDTQVAEQVSAFDQHVPAALRPVLSPLRPLARRLNRARQQAANRRQSHVGYI